MAVAAGNLAAKVAGRHRGAVAAAGLARESDDEIAAAAVGGGAASGRGRRRCFLLFQLRRLDVWPVGDPRRPAAATGAGPGRVPEPTRAWSSSPLGETVPAPYRSVAAWVLLAGPRNCTRARRDRAR